MPAFSHHTANAAWSQAAGRPLPSLAAEAVTVVKLCSGFYNDMVLKGQP